MKNENVLYLDDFLCLDNNLNHIKIDELDINSFSNIYEVEEYIINKAISNEYLNNTLLRFEDDVYLNTLNPLKDNLIGDLNLKSKSICEKNKEKYKPKHVRGMGAMREGYCSDCDKWYRLKTSSYWYHMNFKHGINSKGLKFPEPETRITKYKVEAMCSSCNDWICLGTKNNIKSIKFNWYRHWQKEHTKND